MPIGPAIALSLLLNGSAAPSEVVMRCFNVRMTAWTPTLRIGADVVFITLPSSMALTTKMERTGNSRKIYVVVPANGRKASQDTFGYWWPEGDKTTIEWGDGYSGVRTVMGRTKGGLEGTARTFWDFPRPVQTSHVVAREVRCTGVAHGG
jgi:hypothetical protein